MSSLYRQVIFPAWHWARRDGLNKARRDLARSQWLSVDELAAVQQAKLARLLHIAQQDVPFYRTLLGRQGVEGAKLMSTGAFREIPPLTKEIIRREGRSLIRENLGDPANL